jgi:hypothetical protein
MEEEVTKRTIWYAPSLKIKDEPLLKSLLEYRQDSDRWMVVDPGDGNLVSSVTDKGTHMPIIDLDFPHQYIPSSSNGHAHLYLDVEMNRFKLFILVTALYLTGVIELGHWVWTLRRGASFVRKADVLKKPGEDTKPSYGWLRRLK